MQVLLAFSTAFIHAVPTESAVGLTVGEPDQTQGLRLDEGEYQRLPRGDGWVLYRKPSGRYYDEDLWGIRVADESLRAKSPLVLEVEFWDEGYGVIQAQRLVDSKFNGAYAAASRAVSYTRLNTGQWRKAAFEFKDFPASSEASGRPDFTLTGIQYLRSIRLADPMPEDYWSDLQRRIPLDVKPAATLARPMDIVCSAGAAVHGGNERLKPSIDALREQLPLAKALGFNGVEAYVRWDTVEPAPGQFDWSLYDAIVEEIRRYDLKLFPLLIVGSAYTLPEWFYKSDENVEFVCLEHGLSNPIQSIWSPYHRKHVTRFLRAFGERYEPTGCLLGVRLGSSGNYGESQYPAQGDWGFKGQTMHLHIGMWAGDRFALEEFKRYLLSKYENLDELNKAWESKFASFDDVRLVLPEQCTSKRQRLDTYHWYTDSMSNWCEWWAVEARKAMPNTPIYQSAGGWGAAEIGTDYSAQTKSMLKIDGGIRLTNELDSFHQAYYATRLCATAARCYDVPLGFEPAMGHTARGTAGRIFNCVSNDGDHFFTYGGNVFNRQTSIENWLKLYPLFDARAKPLVEVALYYPQTMNFLSQDTFRYLNAWGFNNYAREIREDVEVDYLDDRLILDGFLDRYKVLAWAWGNQTEKEVIEKIDAWVREGGTLIFPCFLYTKLATVEGDTTAFDRWTSGDTGKGRFHRYLGDDEPPSLYADFVRSVLNKTTGLAAGTRVALEMKRPPKVYISAQDDDHWLVLNFHDDSAVVEHEAIGKVSVDPYGVRLVSRGKSNS